MSANSLSAAAHFKDTRRAFVCIESQCIHYRVHGQGPVVVMLHDSPRSSRLHLPTMKDLARDFTVVALDTPGYGNSDPLDLEQPEIEDFADALAKVLSELGLETAPLYATHTSAKIAIDYAARFARPARLILDGLSIPETPTPAEFITAYMRPFRLDDDGAFIAREWVRIRDMLRWFPWFSKQAGNRMPLEVTPEWIEAYTADLFAAGPHYSDAYAAAMRYDPKPALANVSVRTMIGARADDVLHDSLQRVPVDQNSCLATASLPANRDAWLDWLVAEFKTGCEAASTPPFTPGPASGAKQYVDTPTGQMFVRQYGRPSQGTVLILDTPTLLQGQAWAKALESDFHVLLPELPGFGNSDAVEALSPDEITKAMACVIETLADKEVHLLATGFAAPLAMQLAAKMPDRVSKLVIDGAASISAFPESSALRDLTPRLSFNYAGTHLHEIWHMLRDNQASWPWYDRSNSAHRKIEPLLEADALYDSFMGILMQPAHYGDAVVASRQAAEELQPQNLSQETLFLTLEGDPAYAGTQDTASQVPHAHVRARPADMSAAGSLIREFLTCKPGTLSADTSIKLES
ncbi:alpha/beta fold hydrolase [Henriciella sp. AS95]|uniref:alpha/beta fold hydrolase n=1 Tax=Henriciella sp. AS95 TaxID=3135782 RepID=UPI00316DD819